MATLLTMRQTIARRMGKYQTGIITSGSTSALFDTNNRFEGDGKLTEAWVEILSMVSGTVNLNLVRKISGNIQASKGFAMYSVLPASVASGDTYALYEAPWKPQDYVDFINESLQEDYPTISHLRTDESITVSANTWTYACPSGMDDIRQVWFQEDLGTVSYPYTELDGSLWEVTSELGVKTLRLRTPQLLNRKLRLVGTGRVTDLSANADTVEFEGEDLELIYYGVMYRMWEQLESRPPVGNTEKYAAMASRCRKRYEYLKKTHNRRLPHGVMKTPVYDGGWDNT